MLTRGDKLAHYTIESLLGTGGMGAVYLAMDSRLHRRVALKVILDEGKPEDVRESAARLLREARAAASLTHPNVVSVFEVGEIDGRVFLAMEYVVGKTLRDLMRDPEIIWQRRLRWLVEVARALGAAHRDGLVHRDIKPENVMVREDGIVKVLDFGIARRMVAPVDPTGKTEQAHFATLTGKGLVIGTPMYMAPEQLKGGDPDTRTDQFSWGVMTYEVLSGERPWPEKSDLLAAVATILTEAPTSLRKLAPDLPPAVETVVARTIARSPGDRFESMDEVAELLDPLAVRSGPARSSKGNVSTASSPSLATATAPPQPAHDTRQAMVTAKSPEHPLAPAPQKRVPRRRWPFIGGVAVALAGSALYYRYGPHKPVVITNPTNSTKDPLPPDTGTTTVPLTDVPEALAEYKEAMQKWRDGSAHACKQLLERAIDKDPAFAAAHLALALELLLTREASGAQEHYQKAFSHRDRLPPREVVLLDAIDPLVRPSQDLTEGEVKLIAAAKKYKQDATFELVLGYVREWRSDFEQARSDFDQAITRDGAFIPAQLAKGRALEEVGKPDEALEAYGKCIHASAAAAICLEQRMLLLKNRGECSGMEQDARAWQAVEPEAWEASYYVAEALMTRAEPIESVEVALRQAWEAMPKDARASEEAEDRANLALALGDFQTAERATLDWDAARIKPEIMLHTGPQMQLAYLAYETGDLHRAGRIADAFLRVAPAMTPSADNVDPTIWAQEYLFRNGVITKADLEAKRQAWLKSRVEGRTQQDAMRLGPFLWAHIYASFAENLDEAHDALDKLNDYLPLPPPSRRTPHFNAWIGKAYALASKADDALPPLRSVTSACIELEEPIVQTRSFYFLGMALENKGDIDGARKAYQVVVDRWGSAKTKSRTAEEARKRLKALE